jgi:hypothetical protein
VSAEGRVIEYVPLEDQAQALVNPKGHNDDAIARSIGRFGFVEPVVLDERTGRLVAGHGRLDSLRASESVGLSPPDGVRVDQAGRWLIPVVRGWRSNSDQEAHALGVALNQTTIAGGFDSAELAALLQDLHASDAELVEVLGFEDHDIAVLLAAKLDAFVPPDPDGDMEDFATPGSPTIKFDPADYTDVIEAAAAVRAERDDVELTDGQAVAVIARLYVESGR